VTGGEVDGLVGGSASPADVPVRLRRVRAAKPTDDDDKDDEDDEDEGMVGAADATSRRSEDGTTCPTGASIRWYKG
jgi:hypothetical protein